jgi:RHS repeat-associated protein
VIGNGVPFRNYTLEYSSTTLGYQRLTKVTEKTGDNSKAYNPTLFTYENTPENITLSPANTTINVNDVNFVNCNSVPGDFTGDGKMDFLLYPKTGTNARKKYWLFTNLQSGINNIPIEVTIPLFTTIFSNKILTGNTTSGFKLAPMDGFTVLRSSATSALATFENYLTGTAYTSGAATAVFHQYTKSYTFPKYTYTYDFIGCGRTEEPPPPTSMTIEKVVVKEYLDGDFNGDGLTDLLAIDKEFSYTYTQACNTYTTVVTGGKTYFVNLDKRLTTFVNFAGTVATTPNSKFQVSDFNGDGKSDLFVFDANSVRIYGLNDNNTVSLLEQITGDTDLVLTRTVMMGDYNGDGKSDFIIPKGVGSNFAQYLSTGINLVKSSWTYELVYNEDDIGETCAATFYYIPTDFNGDGKTDIIFAKDNGCNGPEGFISVRNYRNTGTNFVSDMFQTTTFQSGIAVFAIPIFLNFDKPDAGLQINFVTNNRLITFNSEKNFRRDKLLKTIKTGDGVTETITYKPLKEETQTSENIDFYKPVSAPTENYPNKDIFVANHNVVSKVELQSSGVYKKQLFSYHGAVVNLAGINFFAFRALLKTNWHNSSSPLVTTVSKYDIALRGAISENYSVLNNLYSFWTTPSSYIGKTVYKYNTYDDITFEPALQSNNVFKVKNTLTTAYNGLETTSINTTLWYDLNNNVTESTSIHKEAAVVKQTSTITTVFAPPSSSPHIVGRATSKNTAVTVTGDTMIALEQYTYTNNLLSQLKKQGNGTVFVTEDYLYDNFGNMTKKTLSAPGLIARVLDYEYDPSGRFLKKHITVERSVSEFINDPNTGWLTYEKDGYGKKNTYTYDKWGKKINTQDYTLKNTAVTYGRLSNGSIMTSTGEDGSVMTETIDDLGRKIKTGNKNINGNFAYKAFEYDIHDRCTKVSEPYIGTATPIYTETKYDAYGRVNEVAHYNGRTVTYAFLGLSTTESDGIKTKVAQRNAMGKIVAQTDNPGGTVNYTYFANGNLKTATYGTNALTVYQDGWGRKVQQNDPATGDIFYTYNHFGETTKETSLIGYTNYFFDQYGRLETKNIVGTGSSHNQVVTYQYLDYTTLPVLVDLIDNSAGEEFVSEYFYDTDKRLIGTYESNPESFFRKDFVYDTNGKISRQYYYSESNGNVADKWIKYTYQYGYQKQIIDEGTNNVLWQIDEVNARGQLVSAYYATNFGKVSHTYDSVGLPHTISYQNVSGPNVSATPFVTFTTNFNPQRKLLDNRTSTLFGTPWTESFSYDFLDRLLTTTDNNAMTSQAYDNAGRITSNSIGNYSYDTASPYRLKNVELIGQSSQHYYDDRDLQEILYTPFHSPLTINEDGKERITYKYNGHDTRSVMYYGGTQTAMTTRPLRKYYSNDGLMEIKRNITNNTFEHIFYIGGDGYKAPVIFSKDASGSRYNYLHRDYLGSILAITDATGTLKEKRHFDAWGEIVKLQNGSGADIPAFGVLDRGFTGHEHLQGVKLVHMNGRLYDPKLHRFLSPDNYIQELYNTQNYNRYGYVWNNPLTYTDPSGELFGTILTAIWSTWMNITEYGFQFGKYDWGMLENAWKIDAGFIKTDPNRTFFGQVLQLASRFLWENYQMWAGNIYSHLRNLSGSVDQVRYFGGATFVISENSNHAGRGISLGNFINVDIGGNLRSDEAGGWMNSEGGVFWHEYGHTFQSQRAGIFYLPAIGVPSIFGAKWTETSANRWAWRYADQFNYLDSWPYDSPFVDDDFPLHQN